MTINKTAEVKKLTLTLMGRLDTMTAPQLEEVVKKELDGMTEFVMDFEKLDYLSSAGRHVILAAQKIMKWQGNMVILRVNETIMEVFEVTGFSGILTGSGAYCFRDLEHLWQYANNGGRNSIEDFEIILAARDARIHEDVVDREGGYQAVIRENRHLPQAVDGF